MFDSLLDLSSGPGNKNNYCWSIVLASFASSCILYVHGEVENPTLTPVTAEIKTGYFEIIITMIM